MDIFIANDHVGVELKKSVVKFLKGRGIKVTDFGTDTADPVDYPDLAIKVAKEISKDPKSHLGILICATGVGMCMAANRVKGVLAGTVALPAMAERVKSDDNINVLCLGAAYLSEDSAIEIVDNWLNTPFSAEERHIRRLKKITDLD
ncbi:MAG: RpiB/LacA/LacB family sugar-phosphate isomerase [Patescibacteria group bacterium]|jgi:ribose 5-phosphate isomerase B